MRSIWSGTLSFGLLNIPVSLFSASKERALKFNLFDKNDNCPISYKKVCRLDDHPVDQKDIVKGYEYQKGQYVILTKDDFKKASPRKTGTIDVLQFTDENAIDERYFEKPYFIAPEEKSAKAYVLLRDAIRQAKKAAIGRFVLKEKEHLALIKPEGDMLTLVQLRYEDELTSPESFNIPASSYSEKELEMAISLINSLYEPFDASKFKDTYTDELKRIIEAKAKGHRVEVSKERSPAPSDMSNVLKLLEESLHAGKGK